MENKKKLLTVIISTVFSIILVCLMFVLITPTKADTEIGVDNNKGVTIYISGEYVEKQNDNSYIVTQPCDVNVVAINEYKKFTNFKISGDLDYEPTAEQLAVPVLTIPNVQDGSKFTISVDSVSAQIADVGKTFFDPYEISNDLELLRLADVFRLDETTFKENYGNDIISDLGFTSFSAMREAYQYGYFELTDNILVDKIDKFYGIGTSTYPFGGCFNFNGNNVILNVSTTSSTYQNAVGFFGNVSPKLNTEGDPIAPCAIFNANVKGSILFDDNSTNSLSTIDAGVLTGKTSGLVLYKDINCSASLNVTSNNHHINLGGVFGNLQSNIDNWSNIQYSGVYSVLSAQTNGQLADVNVGCYSGLLSNVYSLSFADNSTGTIVNGESSNVKSGNSVVGGIIGKVSNTSLSLLRIRNVSINNEDYKEIVSTINNGSGTVSKYPSAAAFIGTITCSSVYKVALQPVVISKKSIAKDIPNITIESRNLFNSSLGNVYAGGMFGYISDSAYEHISFEGFSTEPYTIFDANVKILAEQNGVGEVFAGGVFAINAFNTTAGVLNLTSSNGSIEVDAIQTSSTNVTSGVLYEISAGFFTSVLPTNYSLSNFTFTVNHGHLYAEREVGSTVLGPMHVGGLAGRANGSTPENSSFNISNVTLNLNSTRIDGLISSFDGVGNTATFDNNLCVGGFIGFIQNYGTFTDNDFGTHTSSPVVTTGIYGVNNIDLNVNLGDLDSDIFIYAIQNAPSGNQDNKTEGYLGGMFGYVDHSSLTDLTIDSIGRKATIYFNSTNNPNTSACGGLIGANRLDHNFGLYKGKVNNFNIVGRAYFKGYDGYWDSNRYEHDQYLGKNYHVGDNGANFDVYELSVGGAVGILGYANNYNPTLSGIVVSNCDINSIGENVMLTYSGGVVGSAFWGTTWGKVHDCHFLDGTISASSASSKAYAGGILGLAQRTDVLECFVYNADIVATANDEDGISFAAGIVARVRTLATIKYCVSNASLAAFGKYPVYSGIAIIMNSDKEVSCSATFESNYYDVFAMPLYDSTEVTSIHGDAVVKVYYDAKSTNPNEFSYNNASYSYDDNTFSNNLPLYIAQHTVDGDDTAKSYLDLDFTSADDDYETIYNYLYNYGANASLYTNSGLSLSIEYYDSSNLIEISGSDAKKIEAKSSTSGIAYAAIKLTSTTLDKSYIVSYYPIYVNDGITSDFDLLDADNNEAISSSNASSYYSNAGNTYIKVEVGNLDDVQNVKIKFDSTLIPNYSLYKVDYSDTITSSSTDAQRLNDILNKCSDSENIAMASSFNGMVDIEIAVDSLNVYPLPTLTKRTVVTFKFGSNYVVLDFVPNYIVSLIVEPNEKTPYIAIKDDSYVFAPGDTINFDVKAIKSFTNVGEIETNVKFSVGSHDAVTNGHFSISSNGTALVSGNTSYTRIPVICTYIGSMYEGNNPPTRTIYIDIATSLNLSTTFEGASFDAKRKVVYDNIFEFKVTPLTGYGYNPDLVKITLSKGSSKYDYLLHDVNDDSNNNILYGSNSGTIVIDGYSFTYKYDSKDGSYSFVIPKEVLVTSYTDINIQVSMPHVYNLIFDKGITYSSVGDNDRYFVYTVRGGSKITTDLYNEIKEEVYVSRYGYELKGYYLTDIASSITNYGNEFGKMAETGTTTVNAPLYFYSRWTYDVCVETPYNLDVKSSFPLSLLEKNDNGNIQLVPINSESKFSFEIIADESFVGTPQYQVFVINSDGEARDITEHCIYNIVIDGFEIDPEHIDGVIYIKVFSDSISFNNGESEETESNNTDILEDGVFTLHYSKNYSEFGINSTEAMMNGNITFKFSEVLPSGTTLRLYRHVNKTPVDIGSYTIPSTGSSSIPLSSFTDILSGEAMGIPEGYSSTLIYFESYYIVVTLPLYIDDFVSTDSFKNITASVYSTFKDNPSDIVKISYGTKSKEYIEGTKRPENYSNGQVDFMVYDGVNLSCTYNSSTKVVTFSYGSNVEGVEDYRHENKVFMWRVSKDIGVAADYSANKTTLDGIFGSTNYQMESGNSIYYLASVSTLNISALSTLGYTVSLIEVDNIKSPASEVVIWSSKD